MLHLSKLASMAVLAAALLLVVLAALLFWPSDNDTEPDEGAVVTTAPTPSSTPAPPAILDPFDTFRLEANSFAELIRGVDAIPSDRTGVYFLDIDTAEVEGWSTLLLGTEVYALAGDNRMVAFRLREQAFREGVVVPAGFYIADRGTGGVYRWQGSAEPVLSSSDVSGRQLATRGGRLLLRDYTPDGQTRFAVLDLDAGAVVSTFAAEGTHGLLSPDGETAVVLAAGTTAPEPGIRLSIVDLQTNNMRSLHYEAAYPLGDVSLAVSLRNSPDDAFLAVVGAGSAGDAATWLQHAWAADLIATGGSEAGLLPSPDGSAVAAIARLGNAEADQPAIGFVLNAIDTRDGADLFRVIGVIPSAGYSGGNPWLADTSGIVVTDPSFDMIAAMRDGSIRPYVGMPSPEDPSLFAVGSPVDGGPAVRDASGNTVVSAEPPNRSASFVPPWGETGDEIRFMAPHGGHGGIGFAVSLVQPYVEAAPYDGPSLLQLKPEAEGRDIFEEPGGSSTIGTVTELRVAVGETRALRLEPADPGYAEHCDLWRATTQSPSETECRGVLWGKWAHVGDGWILVQVNAEGA